jgi:plastocyanin
MTRTLARLLVGATLLVATVAGCGGDDEPSSTSSAAAATPAATKPAAPEGGAVKADIADFAFAPKNLTVKVGEAITWTNSDSAPHTVTAKGGAFDSGNMQQGDTFTWKADKAGTFEYLCDIHPSMVGTVTVQ